MEIILIRHGMITPPQDEHGNALMYPTDTPLNKVGQDQARNLAGKLGELGIYLEKIYTSPYKRALQTAEIIAERLKIPVVSDHELREPDIPGYIGVLSKEIESIDIYAHPRSSDQETYEHLIERIENTFWRLFNKNEEHSFGIVSHGDPIQVLIHRLQNPAENIKDVPRMDKLRQNNYLCRGDAWRLQFNSRRQLKAVEHIGTTFQF